MAMTLLSEGAFAQEGGAKSRCNDVHQAAGDMLKTGVQTMIRAFVASMTDQGIPPERQELIATRALLKASLDDEAVKAKVKVHLDKLLAAAGCPKR
jgi:hypothetical protein